MKFGKATLAAVLMAAGLGACGEGADTAATEPAAGDAAAVAEVDPAIRTAIETRQTSLKDLGASIKTISDQTKSSAPDMAAIGEAAAKVQTHASALGGWFPAGTGPSSGVKTEALETIWSAAPGFEAAVVKFQTEAANMTAAVATGDAAAVTAAFPALGGSCKNCHDTYRLKKE